MVAGRECRGLVWKDCEAVGLALVAQVRLSCRWMMRCWAALATREGLLGSGSCAGCAGVTGVTRLPVGGGVPVLKYWPTHVSPLM